MQEFEHDIYTVKIVNKRPRNLLNEIQNVFINGKQVKTAKITQIIPWFSQFYAKTTTGNSMSTCMRQQWPLHGDGQFASLQHLTTELSGCNQLTAPWNWVLQWVVDI